MRTLLLGEALVDLVCEKPVASPAEADAFVPYVGGAAANVAVVASRVGASVALASGAGDDAWGQWLRAHLAREGVDLQWFVDLAEVPTPVAFATVDDAGEPSFLIYGDGIAAAIEALEPVLLDAVEACDALFFSSNTMVGEAERALTLAARDRALELGRPVLFDPNLRPGRWAQPARATTEAREGVAGAFLVKCNRAEATALSGEDDPEAAAAGLLAAGARHVVITLGADGAILRGGGLKRDVRGVPARAVCSIGAGDAVTGTLLGALGSTDFYPSALAAALPDAVAAGAAATERWGAT